MVPRPPSCSTSLSDAAQARRAESMLKTAAARREDAVKASVRQSARGAPSPAGSAAGRRHGSRIARGPARQGHGQRAAAIAVTTPSVRSWRTIRPRPAPRARRSAISRCRSAPRARMRFATLTQAISITRTAAACQMARMSGSTGSPNPRLKVATATPRPVLVCGCSFSIRPATTASSARAWAGVPPSARRPRTVRECWSRRASEMAGSASGTQACTPSGNWNRGGAMPTTSYGSMFRVTVWPTIGCPPKLRRQSASLRITRRSRPFCASSGRNARPAAGATPRASKNPGETAAASTCSEAPRVRRLVSHSSMAIISASAPFVWACQSRRLAGDTFSRSMLSVPGPVS